VSGVERRFSTRWARRAGPDHSGRQMETALPATVSFPFGLPESGDYRIFVQVKRHGRQAGAFDVSVQ
jgi:hypothetical protein